MIEFLRKIDEVIRPSGRVFYGWWIVLSSASIQLLAGLLFMQSFGAYVAQLERDFGWSKAVLAGAYSLTRIESGLLGPLQGYLCDRYGPRAVLITGTILFALGFFVLSQVETVLTFYLAFVLIALGSSLGGFASLMVAIVNWFERHRSKAVAVSQIGYAIGGLSVPLVVISLEFLGWRTTAAVSGGVILLLGLPMCLVIRHRPSAYGQVKDGIYQLPHEPVRGSGVVELDMTVSQAVRTPAFWLLSVAHSLSLLTVSSVAVHLYPHLTTGLGYSPLAAGFTISMMTGCQLIGQIVGGVLGDRFQKRVICAVCLIAHAAGMLSVAYASNFGFVLAFAVLHGCAWGTRGPLMISMRADYFGARSFGIITGFSGLIVMLGMSTGPLLSGFLADMTGSYRLGFTVIAATGLLGSVLFLLAKRPRRSVLVGAK